MRRLALVVLAILAIPSCGAVTVDRETGRYEVDLDRLAADVRLAWQQVEVVRASVDLDEQWDDAAQRVVSTLRAVEVVVEAAATGEPDEIEEVLRTALDELEALALRLSDEDDVSDLRAAVGVARAILLTVERRYGA